MKKICLLSSRYIAVVVLLTALVIPIDNIYGQNTSPLCFTARNGSVTVKFDIKNVTHTIQYSTNGTDWSTYTSNTDVTINANQSIYFMAATDQTVAAAFGSSFLQDWSSRFYFSSSNGGTVECSGNIMSLYGPSSPNLPLQSYAFAYMFYECTLLTSAPILSATTLAESCYQFMFFMCTSLTTAPALPATTLANKCYASMFQVCSSLTIAPALPATTLADYCYGSMFANCNSLTTAPALPATTLTIGCYMAMFEFCSSLRINTLSPGKQWIIPSNSTRTYALNDMFSNTGGTMNGTPTVNTTYYIASSYQRNVTVNSNDVTKGNISGAGLYYDGDNAALTATPTQHHHFARWSDGDTTNPRCVNVVSDSSFTAIFEIDKHNVAVNTVNGTVEGTGTFDYGSIVELKAIPDNHYCGAIWWDGDTSFVKNISLVCDTTLSVSFTKCKCVISATCDHGTITGNGVYEYGDVVSLAVEADEGYKFLKWSDGDINSPRAFIVESDFEVEAICEEIPIVGVENIDANVPFYYVENRIINPKNVMLRIYSTEGKMIQFGNGDIEMFNYPTGVYLVIDDNGHCLKIVVK